MPGMDWEEIERRLHEEAKAEEDNSRLNEIIEDDIKGILHMTPNQLKAELIREFGEEQVHTKKFKDAMEDYQKAIKAAEGGFFSSPDAEKARKIVNNNPTLFKINDKKKSWWDCGVIVITGLFVTLTGAIYGAVELLG